MSEPYIPFFPADYLGDTMHLSLEEHGAYLKLLFVMWRAGGRLDDDAKKICQILGCTTKKWGQLKATLAEFFVFDDGKFFQKRLLAERLAAEKKSDKNTRSGRLGGISKSLKNRKTGLANATDSPENQPSENVAYPEQGKNKEDSVDKSTSSPPPPPKFFFPDWIPAQDWSDFVSMRQRIRKPLTDRAKELIAKDLEKLRSHGHDPAAVLQQSVKNSWLGVFEIKGDHHANRQGKPKTTHSGFERQDYRSDAHGFEVT